MPEYAEGGPDRDIERGAKKRGCETKHLIEAGDAPRA
jgi:hypothetical protein